jgi:hypothetical protein
MRRETNTATTASIAGMDGGETGGRGREGLVPGGQETDMQDQHASSSSYDMHPPPHVPGGQETDMQDNTGIQQGR